MEGKGSFIILLAIIAFLSLALVVLAGYVFFVGPGGSSDTKAKTSETPAQQAKKPTEEELAILPLFEKQYFNLRNADSKQIAVIQVSVKLKYLKKVTDIKNTEEFLKMYEPDIKEIVGTYFLNLTLDQAKEAETKEKARKELTGKINAMLNEGAKEKKEIVYAVIFDDWFYQ